MEAMLSKTAPVFYGDIRSHERVISVPIFYLSNYRTLELLCVSFVLLEYAFFFFLL